MIFKICLFCLCLMSLGSCATKYKQMKKNDGFGYTDEKINDFVYRITFVGNDRTTDEVLGKYFQRRSAELALLHHAPYFSIIESEVISKLPDHSINRRPLTKAIIAVQPVYDLPYPPAEFKTTPMHIITGKIQLFKDGEQPATALSVEEILKSVK